MFEQRIEKPSEDHRICDVRHLELVQAKYVRLFREVPCNRYERVTCACGLGGMHSLMNIEHERVEVHTALAGDSRREGVVE